MSYSRIFKADEQSEISPEEQKGGQGGQSAKLDKREWLLEQFASQEKRSMGISLRIEARC